MNTLEMCEMDEGLRLRADSLEINLCCGRGSTQDLGSLLTRMLRTDIIAGIIPIYILVELFHCSA